MHVLARREGLFGPIRILERKSDGARLYCVKGSVQTMVRADGVSVFGYVHAVKLLLKSARAILMIGGGGGSLATMLARQGAEVTVLEVDPVAEELARTYFGLDERVHWLTTEPISFLEQWSTIYDAVVVDACNADGLVAPFNDADVLTDMLRRVCPDGSLVLNLVHEDGAPPWGRALARKIAAQGLNITLYSAELGWEGNEVLHVRAHGPTDVLDAHDLSQRPAETRTYLMSLRAETRRGAASKRKARDEP
jgi:spermidine synthase